MCDNNFAKIVDVRSIVGIIVRPDNANNLVLDNIRDLINPTPDQ